MNPTSSNNANNANGNENPYGGRVRVHAEPSHVKAPPQTRMVGRYNNPKPAIQRFARNTPTVGSTLPQHPNVQMARILNTPKSAHNPTLNRMLDKVAAKHTESEQRQMVSENAESGQAEAAPPEQVQMACGGCGGGSGGDQPTENTGDGPAISRQEEAEVAPKVQRMEETGEDSVAKAEVAPEEAAQPQTEENISPKGEADTDVQAKPEGPHRTRADPNIAPGKSAKSESAKSDTTSFLQKSESGNGQQCTPALQSELNSSKGAGSPLPESERGFFESRMGADFSNVRVHTGTQAVQMNEGLGAQAFAHGSDIYFNSNKYQPGTSQGRHLMAHELTHTIQQSGVRSARAENGEQGGASSVQKAESEEAEAGAVQKSDSADAEAVQPKAACSPYAARAPTSVQSKCA